MTAAQHAAPPRTTVAWVTQSGTTMGVFTRAAGVDTALPAAVVLHGGALTPFASTLLTDTIDGMARFDNGWTVVAALVESGYRVFTPFTGPNWCATSCTYAGATGTTGIDDCLTVAASLGHPAGQAVVFGGSMGGGNMLAWAAANPSKLVAGYGLVAMTSIVDAHDRSLLGVPVAPSVEAQWGGSWATACLTVDPLHNAASFPAGAAANIKCVWGEDDSTVVSATSHAFAAAVPDIEASWLTGNNHFAFLDDGWDDWDVVRWFDSRTGRT